MKSFNLLTENWIPVQNQEHFENISLKHLLCKHENWQICLSRDDMEMAALQLVVCIVQVVFMPDDEDSLLDSYSELMDEDDYDKRILPFIEWFDLLHPKHPFMQVADVKATKIKSPQSLLTGLPEKTSTSASSHNFFNDIDDVVQLDLNIATIALFNRALNSPSEGGGFKGSLRGGAPATTLISSDSLRQTIWSNILTKETVQTHYPNFESIPKKDLPTWIDPIVPKSEFYSYQIGFRRGLFWQPAKIKLVIDNNRITGIVSEKMVYKLKDEPENRWLHPHSPKRWTLGKDIRKETYLSFTNTAPAWTQLTNILIKEDMDKEGHEPALVVIQYRDIFRGRQLQLIIGGYRNNQAKIEQRRHELVSISKGWDSKNGQENIKYLIALSLSYKNELRNKLYGLAKKIGGERGVVGLSDKGQDLFYQQSESLIHSYISQMDWQRSDSNITIFKNSLNILCKNIFDQLVLPYEHDPKFLSFIVVSRYRLISSLKKLGEN